MLSGTNSNAVQTSNVTAFINQVHNLIKRRHQPGLTGSVTCTHYLMGIIYTTLPQSVSGSPYQQSCYSAAPLQHGQHHFPKPPRKPKSFRYFDGLKWSGFLKSSLGGVFQCVSWLATRMKVLHPSQHDCAVWVNPRCGLPWLLLLFHLERFPFPSQNMLIPKLELFRMKNWKLHLFHLFPSAVLLRSVEITLVQISFRQCSLLP